ncbi:MAG: chorismate synthase [Lachnospiraceae bacterium]
MSGSSFGTLFCITTWGESHGDSMGVVIDGCPSGLELHALDIQKFLERRKPNQNPYATSRKEPDHVEILSGIYHHRTTGAPIALQIKNVDYHSADYHALEDIYRPGHSDYTYEYKYGIRDLRGGGRSSGRETIGRVAAGAIASKLLSQLGITCTTYSKSIGSVTVSPSDYIYTQINENSLYMPNNAYAKQAQLELEQIMSEHDSIGGVIECIVTNVPIGIGEPVFDKLEANLAKAVMSIGSVKGFEIGDGFASSISKGSFHNDCFCTTNGLIHKKSNHAGGVLGGISDGSDLILRAAIKPTPSISQAQESVNNRGDSVNITVTGRHDVTIVPRAVVVVESMVALTLMDMLCLNMHTQLDRLIDFYK